MRATLESGQRKKLIGARPTILYRGDKIRFDPLSRDLVVHALAIDGNIGASILPSLSPMHAVVLATSPLWFPTLDISQRYVLDVENVGDKTIDLLSWVEGVYPE